MHKCTGKLKDTEHIIHTRGLNKHSRIQYEKNKNGDAVLCPDLDYIAYLFTGHLLGEFFSPLTSSWQMLPLTRILYAFNCSSCVQQVWLIDWYFTRRDQWQHRWVCLQAGCRKSRLNQAAFVLCLNLDYSRRWHCTAAWILRSPCHDVCVCVCVWVGVYVSTTERKPLIGMNWY